MAKKTKKAVRFPRRSAKLDNNPDRVYFFRMDGCGHCEAVKQIWPQVVASIHQSHPSVRMIEVESADKDRVLDEEAKRILHAEEINAYPDLRILKKDGSTSTFDSERTVAELVHWIQSNVGQEDSPLLKRIPTPHPKKSKKRGGTRTHCSSRKRSRRCWCGRRHSRHRKR